MKNTLLFFFLFIIFSCTLSKKTESLETVTPKAGPVLNMGFEDMKAGSKLPNGWFQWGTPDFKLQVDTETKKSGQQAICVMPKKGQVKEGAFGCAAFKIPSLYDGKEITLEGYMKLENVQNGNVGLLLRVDDPNGSIGFDNMDSENISGTIDWKKYSTTVPFSSDAKNIAHVLSALIN